jgi:tRNAThr (cytosine32-N3)-methyltransferase
VIIDELALLFTGSRASPEQTTVTEMTEEDVEGDDDTSGDKTLHTPGAPTLPPFATNSLSQQPSPPSPSPVPSSCISDSEQNLMRNQPAAYGVHPSLLPGETREIPSGLFGIQQLGVDRRLIVNRKRQIKMYRVWMQGKFVKLP